MLGTVVDFDALWQTIWTAAAAGLGVAIIYAVAVFGATRSADMRRLGRGGLSAAYALVGLAGGAAAIAAAAWGILLITKK